MTSSPSVFTTRPWRLPTISMACCSNAPIACASTSGASRCTSAVDSMMSTNPTARREVCAVTPSDASARCDATSTWCRNSASSTNGTCCASIWDAATDVRARSTSLTPRSSKRSMTLMMKMAIAESAMLARATPTLRENSVVAASPKKSIPAANARTASMSSSRYAGSSGSGIGSPVTRKTCRTRSTSTPAALGDLPRGEPPERPAQQERGEGAQLAVAVRGDEVVERRAERGRGTGAAPAARAVGRVGIEEPRGLPRLLVGVARHGRHARGSASPVPRVVRGR